MPKVNNGYQIDRDRSINTGARAAFIVDSVGWGTNDDADGAGPSYALTKLGGKAPTGNNAGGQSANNSYWKTTADVTKTTGGDGTANPWWQLEATWSETEISTSPGTTVILYEVGTSAGSLAGANPANNDGTRLYTRKRVGGSSGLGKTQDFSIVGRTRLDF